MKFYPEYFDAEISKVRQNISLLDKFLFELLTYTSQSVKAYKRGDVSALDPWKYADELCNGLAGVLVEEPYYVLPQKWFRAVVGQIMMDGDSGNGKALSPQKFARFCFDIGWDFSQCVAPECETEEQVLRVLSIKDSVVGSFPIKMVLEPNHPCPVGSRWRSPKGNVDWTVVGHPNGADSVRLKFKFSGRTIDRSCDMVLRTWERMDSCAGAKR